MANNRTYKAQGNKLTFKFSYDKDIVHAIKQIPGRCYIPVTKEWVVQYDLVTQREVKRFIETFNFQLTQDEILNDISQSDVNVPLTDFVSKFDTTVFNFKPREYQKLAINYSLTKKRVINGDDIGIGKTYESIYSVEIGDLFPCLVITLDSVKQHFKRSWLNIRQRDIQVINAGCKFESGKEVYIINYQSLGKKKGENGIEIKFKELENIDFKSVIVDESHFISNSKSIRSKAVKKLTKNCEYIFLLTGTAITSKPVNLVNPLTILKQFNEVFGGWNSFIYKFCDATKTPFGLDVSGASNTKELNTILRQNCYFRREKEEVLKDLPEIQETILPVNISNGKEYKKAENDLISYLKEKEGIESAEKAENAEFLVLRNKLRQIVGKGKVNAVKEFLDSLLEETKEKIIVFGLHKEPLQELAEYYKCWLIDGSVKSEDKQLIIDDFKQSKERILLGNMNALGTGTDGLQEVSSIMLIFELPDTPAPLYQSIGRVHRSGQKNNVQIYIPLCLETIDDVLLESIELKKQVTDAVNKGKDAKKINVNSMIVNKLLKKK